MHLRFVTAQSGTNRRRYAQLVQSYRRPDGMPAQKVVANLGQLSDQEAANMRTALEASRQGKILVLPTATSWQPRILANLAYLDVAVALELWRHWKLSELFHGLIPEHNVRVRAAELIAVLTIQRCVAPGSKLEAQRWFPCTALPELMDIEPAQFNNSRIHRVLEDLDRVDANLQNALPGRYTQRQGAFAALFVDVSDAYFEGRGCDLATRGRTKNGMRNRYKVGILLLCNKRGYPLRWKVLPGRTKDGKALRDVVAEVEALPWAQGVPMVFDRAMGTAGAVARLVQSNLCFVTAVRRSEVGSYTKELPTNELADLDGSDEERERKQVMEQAAQRMLDDGWQKVDECLYVRDLGEITRTMEISEHGLGDADYLDEIPLGGGAKQLREARQYRQALADKVYPTQAKIAAEIGVTSARMSQVMSLLRLDEELQREVLAGYYGHIPESKLRDIARLRGKAQQKRALKAHAEEAQSMGGVAPERLPRRKQMIEARLRLVAYFNPQMFVDERTRAKKHLREIADFVADLNRRLRCSTKKRTRESIIAEVTNKLATYALVSVFDVDIRQRKNKKRTLMEVQLPLNERAWAERRRYDGFVLLVADPALSHSGVEIVQLYRAKDAVEKDFQTIKSDIKIRPVFHYTDPKVRAHVTICMLALLLERTLEHRMRRAGTPMTAPACFEALATGHLNMLVTDPDVVPTYLITEATSTQRVLLERLCMGHIIDQEQVTERLHARPSA